MIPLSEILQAKGDADYAGGGIGGDISPDLYNSGVANEYLQHTADLTNAAHRYLAEIHDRNMQDAIKNVNDIDLKNLMPQDRDALLQQYGDHLKDLASNFSTVRNPLSNPDQWATLQANESNVRNKLSQSQQDAVFLQKQQEFVQQHPSFNTPKYQQDVANFVANPVGQRQYFTVNPPRVFDPNVAYKAENEAAKAKYANSATNGKYITDEEGEKVDLKKYVANTAAGKLSGVDANGVPYETLRQERYDNLPANLKANYKDYNDFATKDALAHVAENEVNKSSLKPDEFATVAAEGYQQRKTQAIRLAQEASEGEADRLNRLEIAGLKDVTGKNNKVDANALGIYKNKLYHDMLTSSPDVPDQTAKLNAINNNPNLTVTQKKAQMDAIASDPNNLPSTIANGVLQNIYGDNTPIDHKQSGGTKSAGGGTTSNSITQKLPATSIIGNKLSNDGQTVIIAVKNNLNGDVTIKNVPKDQFYKDLDNIAGSKYAPSVSKASGEWLQKNTGETDPDLNKLHTIFNPKGGLSTEDYNDFLKKNGLQ